MILFWHPTGPLLKFDDGLLYVESLNPETKMCWRMSRKEMFATGWRFMWAAICARTADRGGK